MSALIGDPSLAFHAPKEMCPTAAPTTRRLRLARLEPSDYGRKIRFRGRGAGGLAQRTMGGKPTFSSSKSRGITPSTAWCVTSRTVSGHGLDRPGAALAADR